MNKIITSIKNCQTEKELDDLIRANIKAVHGDPDLDQVIREQRGKIISRKLTAQELGFKPKYDAMTEEPFELLTKLLLSDEPGDIPEKEKPHPIRILEKRINVLKLPISFSNKGLIAALILSSGNVGRIVVILIDCLTKHEGELITDDVLCNIYPWGFYSNTSVTDYVNNFLKPRKCKWSEIY